MATLDRLSEGRLVVQPTVSWHRDEYEAFGVPFERRGAVLDEVLTAMMALWGPSPASFHGEFFDFTDVYSEPKPFANGRPSMWFGGQAMHWPLLRRLVRYGDGFHPFGTPTADDLARLDAAFSGVGRRSSDLEWIGGTRATFDSPDAVAPLAASMESFAEQLAARYTTFCMKPSQHTDDINEIWVVDSRRCEARSVKQGDLTDERRRIL